MTRHVYGQARRSKAQARCLKKVWKNQTGEMRTSPIGPVRSRRPGAQARKLASKHSGLVSCWQGRAKSCGPRSLAKLLEALNPSGLSAEPTFPEHADLNKDAGSWPELYPLGAQFVLCATGYPTGLYIRAHAQIATLSCGRLWPASGNSTSLSSQCHCNAESPNLRVECEG